MANEYRLDTLRPAILTGDTTDAKAHQYEAIVATAPPVGSYTHHLATDVIGGSDKAPATNQSLVVLMFASVAERRQPHIDTRKHVT